ncbi:MAG: flagellar basal body P-ring formation chaperone FlgA [Phycisphaerae bacterium]|nr:flagellar basal body P-ring formation chaperone FlgA [Phycisphaerae bacterium]
MNLKIQGVLWLGLALMSGPVWAQTQTQTQDQTLRIYMPRNIDIKGAVPSLGQVAILRGNESLIKRLRPIAMGRIASPGGQVVIDRNTILSRLASHGVKASDVTLSGAEKIVVQQQSTIVTSKTLADRARAALNDFPMHELVHQVTLIQVPIPVVVSETDEPLTLKVESIRQVSDNQIHVRMDVLQGDKKLAFRDVVFGLKFRFYRLVTTVDIASGTTINDSLVRVVEGISNQLILVKDNALWAKDAQGKIEVRKGLVAMRHLPAGVVLRPGMIGTPDKEILVKRRQNVVIRLENLGLMVSAIGVAQDEGSVGDIIRVKNADSSRMIMAQVKADGSVAPVL